MRTRTRNVDGALSVAAALASPWAATVEGLAAAVALRASGRPGFPAALAAPSALLLGKMIKTRVGRPRPGLARFRRKGRESFPSTHVAGPLAVLACAWRLAPPTAGWRIALALGCAVALLAGRERVREGKHRASDVAAGAALGVAIGATLARLGITRSPGPICLREDGGLEELVP